VIVAVKGGVIVLFAWLKGGRPRELRLFGLYRLFLSVVIDGRVNYSVILQVEVVQRWQGALSFTLYHLGELGEQTLELETHGPSGCLLF
jgi:hypothetical protein